MKCWMCFLVHTIWHCCCDIMQCFLGFATCCTYIKQVNAWWLNCYRIDVDTIVVGWLREWIEMNPWKVPHLFSVEDDFIIRDTISLRRVDFWSSTFSTSFNMDRGDAWLKDDLMSIQLESYHDIMLTNNVLSGTVSHDLHSYFNIKQPIIFIHFLRARSTDQMSGALVRWASIVRLTMDVYSTSFMIAFSSSGLKDWILTSRGITDRYK